MREEMQIRRGPKRDAAVLRAAFRRPVLAAPPVEAAVRGKVASVASVPGRYEVWLHADGGVRWLVPLPHSDPCPREGETITVAGLARHRGWAYGEFLSARRIDLPSPKAKGGADAA